MEKLLVVGADIEIIELVQEVNEYDIKGIVDSNIKGMYYNYPVIGDDDFIIKNKNKFADTKVIITLDDNLLKEHLYKKYKNAGYNFINLISKNSYVSPLSKIGEGTIIQIGVNIGPNVTLGNCVKVNVGANIMHDGIIEDFSTVAPNAVTLGYVYLGKSVFLGSNATVLPRVKIGDKTVIGAGSIVTRDLKSGKTYFGNPAREQIK